MDGDLAYELATEQAAVTLSGHPLEVEHRATNVYRLEDGEWKIVHHHTTSATSSSTSSKSSKPVRNSKLPSCPHANQLPVETGP